MCLQNWSKARDQLSPCEMSMGQRDPAEVTSPQLQQEPEWCQVTKVDLEEHSRGPEGRLSQGGLAICWEPDPRPQWLPCS